MRPGFSAQSATKKLVIKPLKEPPKLPVDYEEKHWTLAINCAKDLLGKDFRAAGDATATLTAVQPALTAGGAVAVAFTYSSEGVCRAVEALVGLKREEKLYKEVKSLYQEHIDRNLRLVQDLAADSKSLVRLMASWWLHFTTTSTYLMHLFLHLDRRYVFSETPHRSIRALAIDLFATTLNESEDAKTSLLNGFLQLINDEREGNYINRSHVSAARDIAGQMHCYHVWEDKFLEVTQQYYYAEGERLVNDRQGTNATSFFTHCHRRLQEEKNRARAYLFARTKPLLEACVQESLIKAHAPEMLQDERMEVMFKACIGVGAGVVNASQQVDDEFDGIAPSGRGDQQQQQSPMDDMRLLYFLLRRRNVLLQEMLRSRFKAFVLQTGEGLIKAGSNTGGGGADDNSPSGLIPQLVNLNEQCEKMVIKAFTSNTEFQISLREGFETVFKLRQNKVAELLAKRMDYLLRDSQKRGGGAASNGEQVVEEQLDSSLRLFNMHPTKDMFEAFFARDLAKRLIYAKSASADLERYVITRLRTISGSSVAVKLEGMMKDTLELSKELNDQYSTSSISEEEAAAAALGDGGGDSSPAPMVVQHPGVNPKCDISIQILTQGYWPTYAKPSTLEIPTGIQSLKEKFTRFYAAKHKNRVLLWQYGLSQATVVGKYTKGKKEFNCSFYQALVLLAFNDNDEMSFGGLLDQTKLEETDMVCALLSLSAGQLKILQRPSGSNKPQMGRDEVFKYNREFVHRLLKIRVPTVQMKEAEQEEQETSDRVFQERVYVVDAVVVRIMKARRTLSHLELLTSVTKQLQFPAQPSDIKKRIEVQIEREYLKRSDNDPSVYEYLA